MSLIFYVECPECQDSFYGEVELLTLDLELHCPFCGLYFKKEESPNLVKPPTTSKEIKSTATEDLRRYKIYRPEDPLRMKL